MQPILPASQPCELTDPDDDGVADTMENIVEDLGLGYPLLVMTFTE